MRTILNHVQLTVLVSALVLGGCTAVGARHSASSVLEPSVSAAFPAATQASAEGTLGAELQLYPAGVIVGVRYERPLGEQSVAYARLAANLTDRQDFGEHDDESGGGFGVGVGVRSWLDERGAGWYYGGRVDLWALAIDWDDDNPARSGQSDIIVLQPAVEGGHSWRAGAGRFDLGLALGAEVNVDTSGEDVGEGLILLLGLTYQFGAHR